MDTCFSALKEPFAGRHHVYSYSFESLAAHVHNHARLMQHWRARSDGRLLDVDYEALVVDPEGVARAVARHCGLPEAEGLADTVGGNRAVSTASNLQVRQPVHRRSVGAWRRYERQLQPQARLLEAGAP
jgi:hypothetical protein